MRDRGTRSEGGEDEPGVSQCNTLILVGGGGGGREDRPAMNEKRDDETVGRDGDDGRRLGESAVCVCACAQAMIRPGGESRVEQYAASRPSGRSFVRLRLLVAAAAENP